MIVVTSYNKKEFKKDVNKKTLNTGRNILILKEKNNKNTKITKILMEIEKLKQNYNLYVIDVDKTQIIDIVKFVQESKNTDIINVFIIKGNFDKFKEILKKQKLFIDFFSNTSLIVSDNLK